MRKRLSHVLVERLRWRPCGPRMYKSPCLKKPASFWAGQPPTVGEQGAREEGPTSRPAGDLAKQLLQSATVTDTDRVAFDDAAQQSWTTGHLPASCDLLAKPAKQFREEKALSSKAQATTRPPKRGNTPVQQPAKSARRSNEAVNGEGQRLATAVEVFSGTGILSRALMSHGFQTMAVDHQPRSSLVPVVRLDLCSCQPTILTPCTWHPLAELPQARARSPYPRDRQRWACQLRNH